MNTENIKNNIWFVYDGDCPLCTNAALALKIKKKYGVLTLVNAREDKSHFVLSELNKYKYDLDEGMIIYDGRRFYHGQTALLFMAQFGENRGLFNLLNKALFWSPRIAAITYPWMRGIRNKLLRRHNVAQLDNLNLKAEPIFKNIFGEVWDQLPVVMLKHYANRPYTNDITLVKGVLDVTCSGPMKYLGPLLRIAGNIPPVTAKNVPVSVSFESAQDSKTFAFNRTFHFSGMKPYQFKSRMLQIKDNEVMEQMNFGLCWKTSFHWEDNCVKLKHRGYAIKLFGHYIPIPLTFLIGTGNAVERPIDDDTFDMQVEVTHPWWGKVYEYKGRFQFKENV